MTFLPAVAIPPDPVDNTGVRHRDRPNNSAPAAALLVLSVAVCLHAGAAAAVGAGAFDTTSRQPMPVQTMTVEARDAAVKDDREAVASFLAKLHDAVRELSRTLHPQAVTRTSTRLIDLPQSPTAATLPRLSERTFPQPLRPALLNIPPPTA